jgi:hypothetical protein
VRNEAGTISLRNDQHSVVHGSPLLPEVLEAHPCWKRTHDGLFLAFSIAFFVEAGNRIAVIFLKNPSEGSPSIYLIRLGAFLIILGAILRKNYGTKS